MALKLLAAALVTFCAAFAGRAFAASHMRAADALGMLMDDLQLLRSMTLERLLPMHSALAEMRFKPLRLAGEHMRRSSISAYDAWALVCDSERKRGGSLEYMTDDDASEVSKLFQALGSLSRRDHEAQYSQALSRLGKCEEAARQRGREKLRLYASLGALAGLAVSVMLI